MCQKKPYYITTPIYYPSGNPHIGHCYTTVACDSIARYRRMQGYDVMFLTGTDEHGLKIEQKAAEKGVTPKEYVDEVVKTFKSLWNFMNVDYDRYIRTTDDYHIKTVQKIFKELYDKGYIYKGEYSGKYCTPCESFWTESQLVDGKCPDCGSNGCDNLCYFAYLYNDNPCSDVVFRNYHTGLCNYLVCGSVFGRNYRNVYRYSWRIHRQNLYGNQGQTDLHNKIL